MNDVLLGRLVQNLLALERVANGISRDAAVRAQQLYKTIGDDLLKIDPAGPPQPTYRRARMEEFLRTARERIRDYVNAEQLALKADLAQVGRLQGRFAEVTLHAALGEAARKVSATPVTQSRVRAILNTDPFQGRLLKEHVQLQGARVYQRTRDQVRMGMLAEEPTGDIVLRVRGKMNGYMKDADGRSVPRFVGGTIDATTREAEALVRTAVTHVANEGLRETYEENEDVLSGIRFAAFLDDRTTPLCLSLDGTVWPVGSPEIRQPGRDTHIGCRSVLVPEVDWAGLGLEPPPEPTRAARDLDDVSEEDLARKVSARRRTGDLGGIEQIPSRIRAEQWLRSQPAKVQDKILGRGKAALFRRGEVTLSDIVRQDGSIVPLRELQAAG